LCKASAKIDLRIDRGADNPSGRAPGQRILAPVPGVSLQCVEISHDESIFWDGYLLASRSDDTRLLARILRHAGQWIVQSQGFKLGYILEMTSDSTMHTYQDCKASFKLRKHDLISPSLLFIGIKIKIELLRDPILHFRVSNEK